MFLKLFLIFTLLPVIELYFLIKVGSIIGALPTVLIILTTGAIGAYMAKREGLSVIYNLQGSVNQGKMPGSQIIHGILILIGAITLITPGFITDIIGLSLIIPASRRFYISFLLKYISFKISKGDLNIHTINNNKRNYSDWEQ